MGRYRVGLETRQRIIDATRDLLVEVGIEGTTFKAITERAGVGAGSFYNLFDSKEDVVLEVVREAIEAVDPDPAGSGTDRLEDLVDAFLRFLTDQEPVARIYLQLAVGRGLVDESVALRVGRSHRARIERFAAAMAREQPLDEEAARTRAELLLAGLTGLGLTALLDPSFDLRAHAGQLTLAVVGH